MASMYGMNTSARQRIPQHPLQSECPLLLITCCRLTLSLASERFNVPVETFNKHAFGPRTRFYEKRHRAAALQNLAEKVAFEYRASVVECGSPMPLSQVDCGMRKPSPWLRKKLA